MKHMVEGNSMLPLLGDLDECISEKVSPENIFPGDLVIYDDKELKELVAHRVISIPKDEPFMFLKGDNESKIFTEKVPNDDILGKVISVKRTNGKNYDMKGFPWSNLNRLLGFLSRYDITPFLFRRRFLDPIILSVSRNPLYITLRKRSYSHLMFVNVHGEGQNKIFALVNGTRCAEALLDHQDKGNVLVNFFVRHRDRNTVFAERFLKETVKVVDDKYGRDRHIFIIGEIFCDLLRSGNESYDTQRIHLIS
ncbi:MAG: S26 family signal peptidase [Candidatus Tantalella remota]|nr:S26 family signal peptidase [Candidatus Tantalella remota]